MLAHVEGRHPGPLLRAPHLQDPPPWSVDHEELSYSTRALCAPEAGGVPLLRRPFVEVLCDLGPASLCVPVPLGTEEKGLMSE